MPLAERGAYFRLCALTTERLRRNLKGTPRRTQWAVAMSTTRWALSGRPEMWIFQPCGGMVCPVGRYTTQTPRSRRSQPSGTGPWVWVKAVPSVPARLPVS
ncbi:hypothetical protein GCM10020256_15510 [Streptomyces thermocoprophilus]